MARKKSAEKTASLPQGFETPALAPALAPIAASPAASADGCVLNFDGNLAVQNIDAARQRINAALASGAPIAVDLSRIVVIDTAGVQLLLAFGKEAASRGFPVELRGASSALATALDVLGLKGSLQSALGNAAR